MRFLDSLGGKVNIKLGPVHLHVDLDQANTQQSLDVMVVTREELAKHLASLDHKIERERAKEDGS